MRYYNECDETYNECFAHRQPNHSLTVSKLEKA